MKKLPLLLFILTTTPLYACANEIGTKTALQDEDIIVKIDGMTCEPCADTVKKIFEKQDSVADTHVALESQTLTIDTKNEQTLSDDKIKELIEWGGYDLISIERLKN